MALREARANRWSELDGGPRIRRGMGGAALLLAMLHAAPAAAILPTEKPWSATPERFLDTVPDHPDAVTLPALDVAGLHIVSYRSDGTPALLWGNDGRADAANLSEEAASEVALGWARHWAFELGVRPEDLSILGATALDGWCTVTIAQSYHGASVYRGLIVFVFRNGTLASLRNELHRLSTVELEPRMPLADATHSALERARLYAPDSVLVSEAALQIWVPGDDPAEARLAYAVRTSSKMPRTELTLHVDAVSGDLLAVDDDVRHADGEGRIRMSVDAVSPGSAKDAFTVPFLTVGGGATDDDGATQQTGTVQVSYEGPRVRVSDQSGRPLDRFDIDFAGPFQVHDLTPNDYTQADPFVHLNVIKAFAKTITPSMAWLDRRLTVNVNLNDVCNAYWDGSTVNFFRSGGGCNNTGQISSIVYHEFGHGYHQYLTNNVVGSIGEGSGDFLAATVLDDPVVGRGISASGAIRRLDQLRRFPDHYVGEVHEDGLIWGTAFWELRSRLIQKHGEWAGRLIIDRIFVKALTEGPGLSTAYPAVLSADDDDNNPSNGTPNSCEINEVFNAHGLIDGGQINHTAVPTLPHVEITHDAPGRFALEADGTLKITVSAENRSSCGTFSLSDLTVHYAMGRTGGTWETVTVTPMGNAAEAVLTGLSEGDDFRYWFDIQAGGATFENGDQDTPFVGYVAGVRIDIHRQGFERGFEDYTHGTIGSDLVDDWETARPLGQRFDPTDARVGNLVVGTDLGAGGAPSGTDGAAKPGRRTFLESPPIVTTGMEDVRLELWQHYAISGTIRVLVDGTEVWAYRGTGNDWSRGWRYLSLPLGDTARDNATGIVIRFEVEVDATNTLGGWSLDDVAVTGVEIPPPPPPPAPEDPPPPNPTVPGTGTSGDPVAGSNGSAAGGASPLTRFDLGGGCACSASPGAPETRGRGWLWSALALALLFIRRKSVR